MAKTATVTPIKAEEAKGAPRHPTRLEMKKIWEIEELILEENREHNEKTARLKVIFEKACVALQKQCNVPPGTPLDTGRVKWARVVGNPQQGSQALEIIDWSKEPT